MTPETSPSRRRWHVGRWLLGLALASCAWLGWREYDFRAAVREARAAGYVWESREPFELIIADWHAALQKATWTNRYRKLDLGRGADLARARGMLYRLRPTWLIALECRDQDLGALKGLSELQRLDLSGCTALQNADALKELNGLQTLDLMSCSALQNVDFLKGLSGLQRLNLVGCLALQSADVLRGLTRLQRLDLTACTALENVDGLKGLSSLERLTLFQCTKIPAAALRELHVALQTNILFPDGSRTPPP